MSQFGAPHVVEQLVKTPAPGMPPTNMAWMWLDTGTGTVKIINEKGTVADLGNLSSLTLANPTGTVGLTAVNGSATTAPRSDSAPALSQAIAPTWTAQHTFNIPPAGVVGTSSADTISPDANNGGFLKSTISDASAVTMNAIAHAAAGQIFVFDIVNASGGAMGTITWNAVYKLAGSFTNPANGKQRTITFYFDGTNWIETGRAAADI